MNNRKNIVHERRDGTKVTFHDVQMHARRVTGRPRLQLRGIVGGPPGWHVNHLDKVQVIRGKEMYPPEPRPERRLLVKLFSRNQ